MRERGAKIIGLDRNEPEAGLVDEFVKIDLSDPQSIDVAVGQIPEGADALCNIAGLPPTAPVADVMKVNFVALRYFTELMVPKLANPASIVNLASLAGVGWPQSVDPSKRFIAESTFENTVALCDELGIDSARSYFFSKEVLIIWTMQNWNTWRDRGIRINSVCPGPVDTPILPDFLETLGERAEEDMGVMGRAGTVEEIAPVVAFLCSDDSRWVNGSAMGVDGGMRAHIMGHMYGF